MDKIHLLSCPKEVTQRNLTLFQACASSNVWAKSVKLKFLQPPPIILINATVPQDDVDIWNRPYPYPEIRTTIQGDVHTLEERTPITSLETLSEPDKTQDESVNTVQETPNSQFRLLLSVTHCMPHLDSEKYVNCSPSPPLFSGESPQNQSPLPPLSPTTSLTTTYNNSLKLFSPPFWSRLACPVQVVQNLSIAASHPPQAPPRPRPGPNTSFQN